MYIAVLFIIQKKKPNPNAVQWVNDETNSGTFIPWSASQQ